MQPIGHNHENHRDEDEIVKPHHRLRLKPEVAANDHVEPEPSGFRRQVPPPIRRFEPRIVPLTPTPLAGIKPVARLYPNLDHLDDPVNDNVIVNVDKPKPEPLAANKPQEANAKVLDSSLEDVPVCDSDEEYSTEEDDEAEKNFRTLVIKPNQILGGHLHVDTPRILFKKHIIPRGHVCDKQSALRLSKKRRHWPKKNSVFGEPDYFVTVNIPGIGNNLLVSNKPVKTYQCRKNGYGEWSKVVKDYGKTVAIFENRRSHHFRKEGLRYNQIIFLDN